jgi:hypothetical protein
VLAVGFVGAAAVADADDRGRQSAGGVVLRRGGDAVRPRDDGFAVGGLGCGEV